MSTDDDLPMGQPDPCCRTGLSSTPLQEVMLGFHIIRGMNFVISYCCSGVSSAVEFFFSWVQISLSLFGPPHLAGTDSLSWYAGLWGVLPPSKPEPCWRRYCKSVLGESSREDDHTTINQGGLCKKKSILLSHHEGHQPQPTKAVSAEKWITPSSEHKL